MDPLNQRLQETFLFSNADLSANRTGRLSVRQQARLRAARGGQRLALAIFIVVMIGSLAVLGFAALISRSSVYPNPGGNLLQMVIIAVVVGGVILIGLLVSRPYLTNAAPRQMVMANGPAEVGRVKPDAAHYEIKIGVAVLRLSTDEQLAAFQPGVAYRVFFLPGPVATVLSGQVIGTEAETEEDIEEARTSSQQDEVVQMQARARPILILLAVLALGIPAVAFAASSLPAELRWLTMLALLALAVAFVYWAIRRVSK